MSAEQADTIRGLLAERDHLIAERDGAREALVNSTAIGIKLRHELHWIYETSRGALMVPAFLVKSGREARNKALADINKRVQDYK